MYQAHEVVVACVLDRVRGLDLQEACLCLGLFSIGPSYLSNSRGISPGFTSSLCLPGRECPFLQLQVCPLPEVFPQSFRNQTKHQTGSAPITCLPAHFISIQTTCKITSPGESALSIYCCPFI